jgi:molybdopterin synthase catalytic subunit/molybdopterin converting factor small subunit
MHVTVRLFAGLKDLAGSELIEEFADATVSVSTLRDRLRDAYPALRPYLGRVAIAVNEEYSPDLAQPLHDGDTVALIPPISGGAPDAPAAANETPKYLVTHEVLNVAAIRDAVMTPASGAVVLFEGVVRNHHEGRDVLRLEYEAYESMAERELRRVGEETLAAFATREVHDIAIHHRLGGLGVGDTSLVVAVSAAHRADAFEAALRAVDRVKETVPVWMKEWGPDGSHWQECIQPKP